jgi:ATPase family associated with various cellular activities (AAA)
MTNVTITERLASEAAEAERGKKVNWDKLDMKVQYNDGRAISLPKDPAKMPLKIAISTLQRLQKDEETPVDVHEIIDAYPLDAAVAFVKAMQRLYGWASPVAIPGFFGPKPPSYMGIKVGKNKEDVVQCPIGGFMLPGVSQPVQTGIYNGGKTFVIHGTILQRDKQIVLELANETRRIVEAESIYKAKAVRIIVDDEGNFSMANPPEFMDTSAVSEGSLVFSDDIMSQINTNILVPIKDTALCKKHNIPLKRGILLEGPYGTGKSLTAAMVAGVCEANGWTFILLNKVQGLRHALEFANRFKPAVVFAEDIDRVAMDRDETMNDLVNTIDGVVSKRSEIMTVLTTNHADKINPVILRPGRLDAVISLKAPDQATVKKLIVHYARELLPKGSDLSKSAAELDGQIPASIRECVERAKLGMIGRGDNKLSDHDIFIAAQTMKNHLALLNKDKNVITLEQTLADSLRKVVQNGSGKTLDTVAKQVEEIHEHVL